GAPGVPDRRSPRAVPRHGDERGRAARRAAVQRVRRVGQTGVLGLVAVVVGASAVLVPTQADAAPFGRTTGTAVQLTAGTVPVVTTLSCTDSSNGSVVIGWSYAGDLPKSFTVTDETGAVLATTADGQARSATVKLSSALALGTRRTVQVQTNAAAPGAWTSTQSAGVPIQFTSLLGLGLVSGTSCVR
ncbi:hypothetical protein, partial [Curtobacterium sp. 179-B 9B NHS]|uniref:hypothetical protein n=1 Tax=Curtobacterium sp. 179-B 9B NHS TaxID=3374293 RepID=UPI0038798441